MRIIIASILIIHNLSVQAMHHVSINKANDFEKNAIDPLSKESFSHLIQLAYNADYRYDLARVELQQESRTYSIAQSVPKLLRQFSMQRTSEENVKHYYCDALRLVGVLGNIRTAFKPLESCKDPVYNSPIKNIDFYSIKNNDVDAEPQKFCSYTDILRPNSTSFTFHQLYACRIEKYIQLGYGEANILNAAAKRPYLEQVAKQQYDSQAAAKALLELGWLYFDGKQGMAQDRAQAIEYWQQIIRHNADPRVTANAHYYSGYAYYTSPKRDAHDLEQARATWNMVAKQKDDCKIAAKAQFNLGIMHYHGNGVVRNLDDAVEYLNAAAEQMDDMHIAQKAQRYLDNIKQKQAALQKLFGQ